MGLLHGEKRTVSVASQHESSSETISVTQKGEKGRKIRYTKKRRKQEKFKEPSIKGKKAVSNPTETDISQLNGWTGLHPRIALSDDLFIL